MNPASGPVGGGNTVTITGSSSLDPVEYIRFGSTPVLVVSYISAVAARIVVPSVSTAGVQPVTVMTIDYGANVNDVAYTFNAGMSATGV